MCEQMSTEYLTNLLERSAEVTSLVPRKSRGNFLESNFLGLLGAIKVLKHQRWKVASSNRLC